MRAYQIIALLVGDPWRLPLPFVKRLNRAQVFGEYFHPRDKYGQLKLWPKRRRRKFVHAPLPPVEDLNIPAEAWKVVKPNGTGVQGDYVCAWWQIWRGRQQAKELPEELLTEESLLGRWKEEVVTGMV